MPKNIFLPLDKVDPEEDAVPIFAFDIETETDDDAENVEAYRPSRFVFGTIYDGENYFDFWTRRKMARFMCQLRWAGWTGFAHNAEYDLNTLFPVSEPSWPIYRNYFGGVFKGARIELGNRQPKKKRRKKKDGSVPRRLTVRILDSGQHVKGTVDDLGEMIGLKKLVMPDMKNATPDQIRRYCRRDAKIVWEVMHRRQKVYLATGCKMGSSVAATSMDLFRREFMDDRHVFRRIDPSLLAHFNLSYHGARTELFTHGWRGMDFGDGVGITFGDVNGMYLSIQEKTRMPILRYPRGTNNPKEAVRMIDRPVEGVARVRVRVPDDCFYPPLPAKISDTKLYFPTGEFEGVFTLNEIRHAIRHGTKILKVRWIIYYNETGFLFEDFAKRIYALRQDAPDHPTNVTYKDKGNSLYGKWAMGGESVMIGPSWWEGKGTENYKGYRRLKKTDRETYAIYTNYIWASYITAGARCLIHDLLVERNGLYTDTDSVATFDEVAPSKELGALGWEGWSRNIEFLALKTYLCRNEEGTTKIRTKGIPNRAVGLFDVLHEDTGIVMLDAIPYKEMDTLAREYLFSRPVKFREGLARGIEPNSWGLAFKELKLLEKDRKRVHVGEHGTRPFTSKELREQHGDFEQYLNRPWYGLRHDPLIPFAVGRPPDDSRKAG